jgi:hypothetical protein
MLSFLLVFWMVMIAASVERAWRTAGEREAAIKACPAAGWELLQGGQEFTKEQLHQLVARKVDAFLHGVNLRNRSRFVAVWADEARKGDVGDNGGLGATPRLNKQQCKRGTAHVRKGDPQPDATALPFTCLIEACEQVCRRAPAPHPPHPVHPPQFLGAPPPV